MDLRDANASKNDIIYAELIILQQTILKQTTVLGSLGPAATGSVAAPRFRKRLGDNLLMARQRKQIAMEKKPCHVNHSPV